uniref:Putative secreted protein n=1 Tax=Ixodes ricinus TaxID=34613 RepID=A0A147BRQ8_IXORI
MRPSTSTLSRTSRTSWTVWTLASTCACRGRCARAATRRSACSGPCSRSVPPCSSGRRTWTPGRTSSASSRGTTPPSWCPASSASSRTGGTRSRSG